MKQVLFFMYQISFCGLHAKMQRKGPETLTYSTEKSKRFQNQKVLEVQGPQKSLDHTDS